MTQEALVLIISAFCQFKNPNIDKEIKLNCSEKILNCSIIKDGQIPEKQVKLCLEKYK